MRPSLEVRRVLLCVCTDLFCVVLEEIISVNRPWWAYIRTYVRTCSIINQSINSNWLQDIQLHTIVPTLIKIYSPVVTTQRSNDALRYRRSSLLSNCSQSAHVVEALLRRSSGTVWSCMYVCCMLGVHGLQISQLHICIVHLPNWAESLTILVMW